MDDRVADTDTSNSSQQPERIPAGNGGWIAPIRSSDRAREVANMRYEKYRKAATRGMVAAAESLGVSTSSAQAAYAGIVERQTELALSPDQRGSTAAASFVAKAIDAMPRRDNNDRAQGTHLRLDLEIDTETLERLVTRLLEARQIDKRE